MLNTPLIPNGRAGQGQLRLPWRGGIDLHGSQISRFPSQAGMITGKYSQNSQKNKIANFRAGTG